MVLSVSLLVVGTLLAYANGANDNVKGVATLFGSGTCNYTRAIHWATATTFLGSIASIFVAGKLIAIFTGAGLVSEGLANAPAFLPTVACAAAVTVLIATRLGYPVSTTHGLLGALLGPAFVAGGAAIDFGYLGTKLIAPLLLSPLMAVGFSYVLYAFFRSARRALRLEKEMCLCVGGVERVVPFTAGIDTLALRHSLFPSASVGTVEGCQERYTGRVFGVNVQDALDYGHYASAGLVCFARGLNDTPKIAAVLLAAGLLGTNGGGVWIAAGMALGGLISAQRVGRLMGEKITPLNHGQGFTANLVTGFLVVVASRFGIPVSTTHVSCGSLFGIGLRTRQGNPAVIGAILFAWVTTLPVAMFFGAFFYPLFNGMNAIL